MDRRAIPDDPFLASAPQARAATDFQAERLTGAQASVQAYGWWQPAGGWSIAAGGREMIGGARPLGNDGVLMLGLRPEDLTPATGDFRAQLFLSEEAGRLHVHVQLMQAEAAPAGGDDRMRCIEAVLARCGISVSSEWTGARSASPLDASLAELAPAPPSQAEAISPAPAGIVRALAAADMPPELLGALQRGGLQTLASLFGRA